jgi:hypothetical protein
MTVQLLGVSANPGAVQGRGVTLRIGRVPEYGGKITLLLL